MLVDTNVWVNVRGWSIAQLQAQSKVPRLVINQIIYSEHETCDAGVRMSESLRERLSAVEDPGAEREQRFVTLGMDALGRVLVVVHTPRGSRVRLISARKASKGEAEQYHA